MHQPVRAAHFVEHLESTPSATSAQRAPAAAPTAHARNRPPCSPFSTPAKPANRSEEVKPQPHRHLDLGKTSPRSRRGRGAARCGSATSRSWSNRDGQILLPLRLERSVDDAWEVGTKPCDDVHAHRACDCNLEKSPASDRGSLLFSRNFIISLDPICATSSSTLPISARLSPSPSSSSSRRRRLADHNLVERGGSH